MAGAVTPFANPCPVCGATDEHAAWAGDVHGFQGATFCPHPRELGHGTGCCCGGRSKPWTAELIPDPARPLDIEERVAALEKCIRFPLRMYVPKWEPLTEVEEAEVRESAVEVARLGPLTEEQEAELRRAFDATMQPRAAHRVIQQPPHLSPDEIRQLLRECVTVVKPGETLVVRVPLTWTPDDVNRYSRTIGELNEALDLPFRTLVVPAEELGVAEAPEGVPGAG